MVPSEEDEVEGAASVDGVDVRLCPILYMRTGAANTGGTLAARGGFQQSYGPPSSVFGQ